MLLPSLRLGGTQIARFESVFVVVAALFGVAENFVGLGKLFEAGFAGLVARMAVRMTFHRELAKRLLDLRSSGIPRNPQHIIEIASLSHLKTPLNALRTVARDSRSGSPVCFAASITSSIAWSREMSPACAISAKRFAAQKTIALRSPSRAAMMVRTMPCTLAAEKSYCVRGLGGSGGGSNAFTIHSATSVRARAWSTSKP